MDSNLRYVNIIFLLFLIIGFGSWLLLRISAGELVSTPSQIGVPSAILINSQMTDVNAKGIITSQLVADRIEQYDDPEKKELYYAQLLLYDKSNLPWDVAANHALLTGESGQLELSGNVKLYREGAEDKKETTVLSERFVWQPELSYGETDKAITLLQPGLTIYSQGATINTETEDIYLLENVRVESLSESQETLTITSEEAHTNYGKHVTTFIDNVEMWEDGAKLSANKMILYTNEDNELIKLIASGDKAHYRGIAADGETPLEAKANIIEYYADTEQVILIGNAEVVEGEKRLQGEHIVYDRLQETVQSSPQNSSRTIIILDSDTL